MPALSRRSGKLLIIITIVAALAGVAGGVVVGPKFMKRAKMPAAQTDKDKEKPKEEKPKASSEEAAIVVSLGDFLVNLGARTDVRYLRTEVSVVVTGLEAPKKGGEGAAKAPTLPEGESALARDRVVAVLSAGDFASLRSMSGRNKLKQQVLARLREALPQYTIKEVLFTSFVMQ